MTNNLLNRSRKLYLSRNIVQTGKSGSSWDSKTTRLRLSVFLVLVVMVAALFTTALMCQESPTVSPDSPEKQWTQVPNSNQQIDRACSAAVSEPDQYHGRLSLAI